MSASRLGLVALLGAAATAGCAGQGSRVPTTTASAHSEHRTANGSPVAPPTPREADCTTTSGATHASDDDADPEHAADDGFEAPAAVAQGSSAPPPFAELDDAELKTRLTQDIGALGSIAIGHAHAGVLVAGVQMPAGDHWELVSPSLSWGTKETTEALAHAIDAVAARFPNTPKAFIGNISAKQGGHLPPHVSHQSGRDVDLGYYLTEGKHRWYAAANASNLDLPRTWHLVRTLIADSDVDLILVDVSVQKLLKGYARSIGEDQAWLDRIFQVGGKSPRPILFHAKGHATHLHIRFYSPAAQELGRRAYPMLLARHLITPPTVHIKHVIKTGETLSHLSMRYKVTPDAIKRANGMKTDVLVLSKTLVIPQTGGVPVPSRLAIPARLVPPAPSAVASGEPKRMDVEPCRGSGS